MGTHYQGTEQARLALDTYIKLSRSAESVTQRVNRHLAEAGLTTTQFGVLEALFHLGPLCQRALADKLLRSAGNLSLVIDNLERRGLVLRSRDETDRRFVEVRLTESGRDLVAAVFERHVGEVVRELGVLSEDDQRTLGALCRKLGLGGCDDAAGGHTNVSAADDERNRQ